MTIPTTDHAWVEANHNYLSAELERLRARLERHIATAQGQVEKEEDQAEKDQTKKEQAADFASEQPAALETLSALFGLSRFERDILLLCAGVELDSSFAPLCAAAQADAARSYPTFSLALAALSEPHWSALAPSSPLRHWRLVEAGAGNALTLSPLRIDERVLHFLAGVEHMDERLIGLIEHAQAAGELVESHQLLADRLLAAWRESTDVAVMPVVQLLGDDTHGKQAVAAQACASLGLSLSRLLAQFIPTSAAELETLIRLWDREAALSASALFVEADELDSSDLARIIGLTQLAERGRGPLIIASRDRRLTLRRPVVTLDVRKPEASEQRALWQSMLGPALPSLNGQLEAQVESLVSQFSLSASTIRSTTAEALARISYDESRGPQSLGDIAEVLWDSCRVQARPRLNDLAQQIEPAAGWDDLVVPEAQRQVLSDIVAHVRQRTKVYEKWGFAAKNSRGLGISALFAGASGTGKTMAAEVIANALRLDLYRIDLSQVVSKYIGETEKNLRQVFDAAEEGGAILLFDEADAMFGKRSEVKDSHDRYANIEVSYLLQRMEAYRGLAILTTNMKEALDAAFMRRIRFCVQFPFPDAAHRQEIWRRVFPASTPTEGLSLSKLARINIAGGNIHNIALYAAFLAAERGEPVRMAHLLRAARAEYAKLERPLTEAEIGGWV